MESGESKPKMLSLVFVFDAQKRVLLGKKKRGFGAGNYNGFGGKQEADETMRECAARELLEESGVRVEPKVLARRGILSFNMLSDGMVSADGAVASRLEVHVFSCMHGESTGEIVESEEMAPEWWAVDSVPYAQMWVDDEQADGA